MVAKWEQPEVFIEPREGPVREQVGKHLFGVPLDVQPRWA